MDLIATMQVMLRRWYVVVPALLLTGVGVVLAYAAIQPTYEARGTVILRSAAQAEDPKTGARNQYADYGNLSIPARVITDALSQTTYQEKLKKAGLPGKYVAGLEPGSLAPIITVIGNAATPAEAIRTAKTVMAELDKELTRRQENLGAPRVTFLTTEVVAVPTEAEPKNGSRLRAAAGVLVLGAILTLSLGFITETLARRRADALVASGRSAAAAAAGDEPGDEPGEATVADAFECGLCGRILGADDIVDHLTDAHSLGSHTGHDFEALLAQARNGADLDAELDSRLGSRLNSELDEETRRLRLRSGGH